MSILSINRDILGQFLDWRYSLLILFLSISFFILLLPKPSLFLAYHQTCLNKTMISDSFTVGSSWNLRSMFGTYSLTFSPLEIKKSCWNWEKYTSYRSFFFSVEIQNYPSKTTIPDSLTVGLSWNFDIWFVYTLSPLGFAR